MWAVIWPSHGLAREHVTEVSANNLMLVLRRR
jgi:hypothetical protein